MDNKVGVTEGDCVIYFWSIVFILVGFLVIICVVVNHGGRPCLLLIFKDSFENRESKPLLLKHREKCEPIKCFENVLL